MTGDEVYGANPGLRAQLEARQIGYVLAVACDHPVGFGGTTQRADALLRQVPARAWQQISCGTGAKGHRYYDWAFIRLEHPGPGPDELAGRHWLLIRHNQRTGELAFYRCFTRRCGDVDIRHAPAPATTDDRPPGNREDHDLRLKD